MKLTGIIFEKFSTPRFVRSEAIVLNNYGVFGLSKSHLEKILVRNSSDFIGTSENGIWIYDENKGQSSFVDIFNSGLVFTNTNVKFYQLNKVKNGQYFTEKEELDTNSLVLLDVSTGEIKEKTFPKAFKYSYDENYLYVRTDNFKKIFCYDHEFNQQWEYSSMKGRIYIDFERAPQIHKSLVIINHAYDTIALNKKTGEEMWKYTFEAIPTSNILMKGLIYAVCQAQLFVINPENGEVLFRADTGYPSRIEEADKINRIGVFPVGEYLYGIADYNGEEGRLKLFNKDASELLDVTEFSDYYINPYGSILPTIHDGKIYQTVRNAYSYSDSGLLVLEISDDINAGIKVADRPSVTVIANPSLKDSHKLQIYLDVNNLDDALRYGELITKEVHYAVGYIPVWDARLNALDSKHNGEMELIIDNSGFEDGCDEYLERMSDNLKEFLESDTCLAGDKRTPIKFSLVKQEKPQWDISGEKLDWPEIRDYKEPLI